MFKSIVLFHKSCLLLERSSPHFFLKKLLSFFVGFSMGSLRLNHCYGRRSPSWCIYVFISTTFLLNGLQLLWILPFPAWKNTLKRDITTFLLVPKRIEQDGTRQERLKFFSTRIPWNVILLCIYKYMFLLFFNWITRVQIFRNVQNKTWAHCFMQTPIQFMVTHSLTQSPGK